MTELTGSGMLAVFAVDVSGVVTEKTAGQLVKETGLGVHGSSRAVQWIAIQ